MAGPTSTRSAIVGHQMLTGKLPFDGIGPQHPL